MAETDLLFPADDSTDTKPAKGPVLPANLEAEAAFLGAVLLRAVGVICFLVFFFFIVCTATEILRSVLVVVLWLLLVTFSATRPLVTIINGSYY